MAVDLPFVTSWPGTLQQTIPAYLYTEYNDDADLQALVDADNTLVQQYVDSFNQINLPVWTSDTISGPLLDWVGQGLYDIARPALPVGHDSTIGPLNTWALNTIPFNTRKVLSGTTFYVVNDDIYKRCMTWALYKGDGKQFSINWLKRRCLRFLVGVNGIDPGIQETYDIGVSFSGTSVTITVHNSATYAQAAVFQAAIEAEVLELPFQFTFTVSLV